MFFENAYFIEIGDDNVRIRHEKRVLTYADII